MTWLSRLLPQSPRFPRLADHNHRTRQAQRRRRMSTLEALEGRTLLSNVVTSITIAANGARTLSILGDTHKDTFTVTENNTTGQVTVTGNAQTLINNSHTPYTTTQAISNIAITLPGDHTNTDVVTITSTGTGTGTLASVNVLAPGVTTPGDEGLHLSLTVTNLTVSGELSVWDAPTFGGGALPLLPAGQAPNAPTTAQIPGYVPPTTNNLGGLLITSVTGSHLGSLYIEQDGCCPATVSMDHDTITGSLTVEEGVSNGDTISLTNSTAGVTQLTQGYGPTMAGCNGSGDLVNVQDDGTATTGIFSLAITQLGPGGGEQILVGTTSPVEVALPGFGITATQHDANTSHGNLIDIESITIYHHAKTDRIGPVPPSIVTSQGNDGSDKTIIDSSVIPGKISVTQGSGGSDLVDLEADTAGFTVAGSGGLLVPTGGVVTISQGGGGGDTVRLSSTSSEPSIVPNGPDVFNDLSIVQGGGGGDTVIVDSTVVVTGNIIVVQGDGAGDQVWITSTTAGYQIPNGPFGQVTDEGGLLAVIQGNGYNDSITITSVGLESPPDFGSIFNNVVLVQGDSLNGLPADCLEPKGDVVSIDETTIYSNLLIYQNTTIPVVTPPTAANLLPLVNNPLFYSDGPGLGNNVVNIGTGVATPPPPATGNSAGTQVYVGNETLIDQGGANNTVNLGGAGFASGPDFETGFLDIYTGGGGGGFVSATNTTVVFGSLFGFDYVINGGGTGNTYSDGGGNNPDPLPYSSNYSG